MAKKGKADELPATPPTRSVLAQMLVGKASECGGINDLVGRVERGEWQSLVRAIFKSIFPRTDRVQATFDSKMLLVLAKYAREHAAEGDLWKVLLHEFSNQLHVRFETDFMVMVCRCLCSVPGRHSTEDADRLFLLAVRTGADGCVKFLDAHGAVPTRKALQEIEGLAVNGQMAGCLRKFVPVWTSRHLRTDIAAVPAGQRPGVATGL